MPSTQIALAGATGNLGMPILTTLLASGYNVTVLSRINGNSSKLTPHSNLTIKEVDFTSVPSLTTALQSSSAEIVISCLATLAIGCQNPLIDASVAAGVKRFIPAEFGMDSLNPLCVALPVCAPKAATQRYLGGQVRANPGFTWTGIANGLFLDWCLDAGIILDVKNHSATLYNGGDIPFSTTLLRDVARAVVGVIENQSETANRVVYVHSAAVTQNQLIRYAKEKDGKAWDVVVKGTEELRRESLTELEKGGQADVDTAMLGFCIVGSWDTEYGCDFSGHLDNEVLGVKELGEDELRELVQGFL
ncbi:NAD(P)-binding protein [Aspergillus californicus]